jgi:hypothetical protein
MFSVPFIGQYVVVCVRVYLGVLGKLAFGIAPDTMPAGCKERRD